MSQIKLTASGPAIAKGPLTVVDSHGNERVLGEGDRLALCRCGKSDTFPLCDGKHNREGFRDPGSLTPAS